MARVIVSAYVVRLPLGGYHSWILQWLVGFKRLGHDVWFVEKSGWSKSCIDPATWKGSDDCTAGVAAWHAVLSRFGLGERWCFVDAAGTYHGASRAEIEAVFRSADLFVNHMPDCEWAEESQWAGHRAFIDGEPGMTQVRIITQAELGRPMMAYDSYHSVGLNVGTAASTVPTVNRMWQPIVDPVVLDLFDVVAPPPDAPLTTVMSWKAHPDFEYDGVTYGSKYLEFPKIEDLPSRTTVPLELAVSGLMPIPELKAAGWRVRDSVEATRTFDLWRRYIAHSRGELTICKNYFVAMNTGFFSDRSAAYLASGRPVIMQDTGFSAHLPVGEGLFAFRTGDEAVAAVEAVRSDFGRHSRAAREIARQYLDAGKVLSALLDGAGR